MIGFITRVNESQGWDVSNKPTRETVANDIKYLCEMAIDRLLWLNDDKDGNISHPELEADDQLVTFFRLGRIIAVPYFQVLLFDEVEKRITIFANVEFDNRDGYGPIALDFLLDSGFSVQRVYVIAVQSVRNIGSSGFYEILTYD